MERALLPVGAGRMAGGVYTLARAAIHDGATAALALAAALVVATDRVPPVVAVLAAGLIGWLVSGQAPPQPASPPGSGQGEGPRGRAR